MPEMPEFQSPQEEEQPRSAPGALDIKEQMEQEVEDMPEGPAKEYLLYKKKVMESAAVEFLQPDEQITDFGNDFLPLPLMHHEAILSKEKMRLAVPRNEEGGYEGIPLTSEEAQTLIEDHPRWRKKWLSERPRDLINFHNTSQYLQIDPTYCPVPRRRSWAKFQKWKGKNKALLNYPVLSAQEPPTVTYVVNTLNQTIQLLRDVPDLTCQMLVKIARMIVTCIQVFRDTEDDDHPWNLFLEGRRGIGWNLRDSPPRWIIMAIYSRLMYLPSHFLQTFKEAFVTGFFKISTQIFHPMAKDLKASFWPKLVSSAEGFEGSREDCTPDSVAQKQCWARKVGTATCPRPRMQWFAVLDLLAEIVVSKVTGLEIQCFKGAIGGLGMQQSLDYSGIHRVFDGEDFDDTVEDLDGAANYLRHRREEEEVEESDIFPRWIIGISGNNPKSREKVWGFSWESIQKVIQRQEEKQVKEEEKVR
ncbi:hypothetical protein L7F22_053846 [Adiantum nelumboides]|nr:hypothetical protein [Adiantum nelumboides]